MMRNFINRIINCYGAMPYHPGKWRISNMISPPEGSVPLRVKRLALLWNLKPGDIIQRRIYFNVYEVNEMRLLKKVLNPGDVFFDVGANIGFYSLIASKNVEPDGAVYSFEPENDIFKELTSHIALNRMENIRPFNTALTDYNGEGYLCEKSEDNSGWTHLTDDTSDASRKVSTVKLDTFLKDNPVSKLDLIKIDTEGYELNVLKGAGESLKKFRPEIIMELNPNALKRNNTEPEEVLEFLRNTGYQIREISKNKLLPLGEIKPGEVKNLFASLKKTG